MEDKHHARLERRQARRKRGYLRYDVTR
jgi:hypothetical protein